MTARLKTQIWVQAYLWRLGAAGVAAYVARRGDDDAGAVMIRIVMAEGAVRLFAQSRGLDGALLWREVAGVRVEAEAEARIAREIEIDSDLWVIDVEDKAGAHYLLEAVEESVRE